MVGYICSAITDFMINFARDEQVANLHGWSLGSFSGSDWKTLNIALVVVLAVFAAVMLLCKPIEAFLLGENYAKSMGVDIRKIKIAIIVLSGILSATVTAFAGPISFVGIAVPFVIKRMLSTSRPVFVIPAVFVGGAAFCMLSDLIARTACAPTELNVSTVTAIFGAPVVIMMMLFYRKD